MSRELRLEAVRVALDTGAVHRGDEATTLTPSAHKLLVYFAEHPMETVSRERLLVAVWGYDGATLTRTVDTTISRLRALLERDPAEPRHLITVYGEGYRFVPWSEAPPEAAAMVLGSCSIALARLQVSWPDGRTFPLTAQEASLLRALLAARGKPLSRSALMRQVWQVRSGRSTRSVDNAVMRLRAKIEAEPSAPQFLKTVRGAGYMLLAQAPAPAAAPRPQRQAPPSLQGRGADLSALQALLASPGLVTLLGTGGVGKTSLARAAAASHDVAFLCDLSQVRGHNGMLRGVAAGLSIAALPPAADAQAAEIGRQLSLLGPALVILDNLEQLIEPAQALLPQWLARAPALRLLVTSRRPLQLPGERIRPLEPLRSADAAALFRTRYTAAGGALRGTPSEAESITALVTQLDGLPLAIELAAARGRLLRPAGLLARMDRRLSLLRGPGTDRHSTLSAAIAWSWELLRPVEQRTLAWCSVFRGFSLEAAEELFPEQDDILDILEGLLDHSLLRTEAVADLPGDVRFKMLDSIRAFAQAQLSPTERDAAQGAHASYFASLGAGLLDEALLQGTPETAHRTRLEVPNFLAAAESSRHTAPEDAAWCTLLLAEYFRTTGEHGLLREMLSNLPAQLPRSLQRRLTRAEAIVLLNGQPGQEAVALLEAANVDAPPTLATAQLLGTLATAYSISGNAKAAIAAYQQGAALALKLGARGLSAMLKVYEGSNHTINNGKESAAACFQAAVERIGTDGFHRERGFVFAQLGQMALQQQRYGYGTHCLREAIASMKILGAHGDRCLFLAALVLGLWMDGDLDGAEATCAQLEPLPERYLTPVRSAFVLVQIGQYFVLTGRLARAEPLLRRSARFWSMAQGTAMMWLSLCDAAAGRAAEARAQHNAALEKIVSFPHSSPVFIAVMAAWREALLGERPGAREVGLEALAAGKAAPLFGASLEFRAALRGLAAALQVS